MPLKSDWLGYLGLNQTFSEHVAVSYTETLQLFYFDWMNGASVYECIKEASDRTRVNCPLPVPENTNGFVDNRLIRIVYKSKIYVVGHSGLTISGLKPQFDNQYVAPKNIQ